MNITVVGGGSWATAIVKILSEQPVKIKWWMRSQESVDHIKKHHHNPKYLSSVELHPSKVKAYAQLKDALKNTEWVILAIPAAFVEATFQGIDATLLENKKMVSAIKGMIPEQNLLVSDWLTQKYGIAANDQCIIAGPCHAEEVALEKQSYLTIASPNAALAQEFVGLMACRFVKCHSLSDLYGVEYAAVMKNIVSLACGIAHGLGAGDNFQAVMVANAMEEIERFIAKIAPLPRNVLASAYLGDLLVTAYSQFSRNRAFGNMIGRGYSVSSAQLEMNMIAEGYFAVKSIFKLNEKLKLEMPITHFAYQVLYEKKSLTKQFELLKNQLK